MVNVRVRAYKRRSGPVKSYTRKKRPKGKKIKLTKEKFVARRDEYGRILGYRRVK